MRAVIEKPEDLGRFVQRIRHDAGLSQQQLAEALGTTQRYLSELEAGKPKRIDHRYFDVLSKLGIVIEAQTADSGWSDE